MRPAPLRLLHSAFEPIFFELSPNMLMSPVTTIDLDAASGSNSEELIYQSAQSQSTHSRRPSFFPRPLTPVREDPYSDDDDEEPFIYDRRLFPSSASVRNVEVDLGENAERQAEHQFRLSVASFDLEQARRRYSELSLSAFPIQPPTPSSASAAGDVDAWEEEGIEEEEDDALADIPIFPASRLSTYSTFQNENVFAQPRSAPLPALSPSHSAHPSSSSSASFSSISTDFPSTPLSATFAPVAVYDSPLFKRPAAAAVDDVDEEDWRQAIDEMYAEESPSPSQSAPTKPRMPISAPVFPTRRYNGSHYTYYSRTPVSASTPISPPPATPLPSAPSASELSPIEQKTTRARHRRSLSLSSSNSSNTLSSLGDYDASQPRKGQPMSGIFEPSAKAASILGINTPEPRPHAAALQAFSFPNTPSSTSKHAHSSSKHWVSPIDIVRRSSWNRRPSASGPPSASSSASNSRGRFADAGRNGKGKRSSSPTPSTTSSFYVPPSAASYGIFGEDEFDSSSDSDEVAGTAEEEKEEDSEVVYDPAFIAPVPIVSLPRPLPRKPKSTPPPTRIPVLVSHSEREREQRPRGPSSSSTASTATTSTSRSVAFSLSPSTSTSSSRSTTPTSSRPRSSTSSACPRSSSSTRRSGDSRTSSRSERRADGSRKNLPARSGIPIELLLRG